MYNYIWDSETGGYLLTTKITGVIKEIRPVFSEELRLLKLDKLYNWTFPNCSEPLLWAEGRNYFYKGEFVGNTFGGGLYKDPVYNDFTFGLHLQPVDLEKMAKKNSKIMLGLIEDTLSFIYKTYLQYKDRVKMFYVGFSGGKDSIVLLDLVQRALPHDSFYVIFGDTTMEFKSTYNIVTESQKQWPDLKWNIARAPFNAEESWRVIGYPGSKLRWCCGVHKTAPSLTLLRTLYSNETQQVSDYVPFIVMAYDGIRAEESDSRASYPIISNGRKHSTQYNCSPLKQWNTTEIFQYIFSRDLPLNDLYRYGSYRVGCKLCPMASNWYEYITNHVYPNEVNPLIQIIKDNTKKEFTSEKSKDKYIEDGGWKRRVGGKDIYQGKNKIIEIKKNDRIIFIINEGSYKWDKWIGCLGDLVQVNAQQYILKCSNYTIDFQVNSSANVETIEVFNKPYDKNYIKLFSLFKNALYKSAYCIGCGECIAECSYGALSIHGSKVFIEGCKQCHACLELQKGCIVARSLSISGGGNNLSVKNISRYQNFGFRQGWLDLYFEKKDDFWVNTLMGTYMIQGFKVWLKEAEITENNDITKLGEVLCNIGTNNDVTWGIILTNLSYNSPIINYYIKTVRPGYEVSNLELVDSLCKSYSETIAKNALSSLKETFRYSPIGTILGQGICKFKTAKSKIVIGIERKGWEYPDPISILYSIYKFAEKSDNLYSFTLSELTYDGDDTRIALSPTLIFGISVDTLKNILRSLANDYPEYIHVNFNSNILEDIYLNREKKAIDTLFLFERETNSE